MPPVCDLNGLRSPLAGSSGIISAPIAEDRVRSRGVRFRQAATVATVRSGKRWEKAMGLQIDDDRSVAASAPEGEVIQPHLGRWSRWRHHGCLDLAKDG